MSTQMVQDKVLVVNVTHQKGIFLKVFHQGFLNLEQQFLLVVEAQVAFGTTLMVPVKVLGETVMILKEISLMKCLMVSLMSVYVSQRGNKHLMAHGETLMDLARALMALVMIQPGTSWILSQRIS